MGIKEARSLVALAELGNITRAAEKLHLSASAIFKQLKLLEGELGVPLYEKAGRQLRLTQAAEVLLPHLRGLLAQHDAALAALDEWKGLKNGSLRIGAGPTFGYYVLPSLLDQYRRLYPGVDTYMEAGHGLPLVNSLQQGALDAVFLMASESLEKPDLSTEVTWDFEIVLVSGLKKAPRRCALKDLAGFPFILYKAGGNIEKLIDRYFDEHGFAPRVVMRFDNGEGVKTMLRRGQGLTMLPRWTVEAELKSKTLTLVRLKEPPLLARMALITRKASYVPGPVSALIALARQWQWSKVR